MLSSQRNCLLLSSMKPADVKLLTSMKPADVKLTKELSVFEAL